MRKYIVKVDIAYVHMEFVFDTIEEACVFMDSFCDHIVKRNDGRDADVYMCRVDEIETEEEAKGEE